MMRAFLATLTAAALIAAASAGAAAAADVPAAAPKVAPGGELDPAYPDADVYIGTPRAAPDPSGRACRLAARYVHLVNTGQYAATAALFADDATFLEPMRPSLQGRAQIDAFYIKRIGGMRPQILAVRYFGDDTECMAELAVQNEIAGAQRYVLISIDHFTLGNDGKVKSMVAFARPARSAGR